LKNRSPSNTLASVQARPMIDAVAMSSSSKAKETEPDTL
jgi:hypothetical protein